jgi:hypothetical protein
MNSSKSCREASPRPTLKETVMSETETPAENEMRVSKQGTALYTCATGYDERDVTTWDGRGADGMSLGIVELTANIPFAPGNVNNASTFDFPVRYESLGDIDPHWVVSSDPHPEVIKRAVAAAKKLEAYGCRAVMGNCGFLANYQPHVSAELTVPFFGSSLLQIPMLLAGMGPDQKVGVVTANGPALENAPALANCGVPDRERLVIYGAEKEPEVAGNHLACTGRLNLVKFERDLVNVSQRMMADHPDVGIVLLECTEFEPHAVAIQEAVRRPVWGFTTMAEWIHAGCIRRRYSGWM